MPTPFPLSVNRYQGKERRLDLIEELRSEEGGAEDATAALAEAGAAAVAGVSGALFGAVIGTALDTMSKELRAFKEVIFIYIFMYSCIYIYIYIYIYACMYVYVCMFMYVYLCMYTYIMITRVCSQGATSLLKGSS